VLDVGLTEAEDLDISGGYDIQDNAAAANGKVVGTLTQGAVSGVFNGADGTYDITVNYLDESDGVATWRLLVDGNVPSTWQGTGGRRGQPGHGRRDPRRGRARRWRSGPAGQSRNRRR